MTVIQEAQEWGERVAAASADALIPELQAALRHFFGSHFNVLSGSVTSSDGSISDRLPVLISTGSREPEANEAVLADNTAAVMDVLYDLDEGELRAAYQRIATAKNLKKTSVPDEDAEGSMATLGVLYAQRSALTFEAITELLQKLNDETPAGLWPDAVVIDDAGTVEYGVQFPGEAEIRGNWLLPPAGSLEKVPGIYVLMVKRPTGAQTFHKMLALIAGNLAVFRRVRVGFPAAALMGSLPKLGLPVTGYQYTLEGELRPVPPHQYAGRSVPTPPLQIEDVAGQILGTIEYTHWQDGGVVILRGKFPLQMILAFGESSLSGAGVLVPSPALQISYVLPLTQSGFAELLTRFQARSNLRISRSSQRWTVQKVGDEGTSTPFIGRLMLGLLTLRDGVYDESTRERFDGPYQVVTTSLTSARQAFGTLEDTWRRHSDAVAAGTVVERSPHRLTITEGVDRELRREAESFLNSSVRALKHGMRSLAAELGLEIGFLFQKQSTFDARLATLRESDPVLATYLEAARRWSEPLVQARNAIEHEGWVLPGVRYLDEAGTVRALEPAIRGKPATDFTRDAFHDLCCFVEELTAYGLQRKMPPGVTITEVPPERRSGREPGRFAFTPAKGGLPSWKLRYSDLPFEEV